MGLQCRVQLVSFRDATSPQRPFSISPSLDEYPLAMTVTVMSLAVSSILIHLALVTGTLAQVLQFGEAIILINTSGIHVTGFLIHQKVNSAA